jgi:hypothetical protein
MGYQQGTSAPAVSIADAPSPRLAPQLRTPHPTRELGSATVGVCGHRSPLMASLILGASAARAAPARTATSPRAVK